MAIPAIIHLMGEDAFYGELDQAPNPNDNFLFLRNIRKKDGKQLAYVTEGAEVFLYAWNKITFVEIMQDIAMPSSGSQQVAQPGMVSSNNQPKPAGTTVVGFFREDD
jgi:hypothetical protein